MIVDSINGSATPVAYAPGAPSAFTWSATQAGWFYTPSVTYDLQEIETKFGVTDNRLVTVEIYHASRDGNGALLSPTAGDAPLRSALFAPQTNAFAGGAFAPLTLTANQAYFIGFKNVRGLGMNVTDAPDATGLAGGLRFGMSSQAGYLPWPVSGFLSQPILQFLADVPDAAAVPEPSSLALFGIGACALLGGASRRRPRTKFAALA